MNKEKITIKKKKLEKKEMEMEIKMEITLKGGHMIRRKKKIGLA